MSNSLHVTSSNSGALDVNFTIKEMVSETSGLPPPPAPNSDPDDQPPPPPVEFAATRKEMLTYVSMLKHVACSSLPLLS
jgi:hypothetical protein